MNRSLNRGYPDILIVMIAEKWQIMKGKGKEDQYSKIRDGPPLKAATEMSGTAPLKISNALLIFSLCIYMYIFLYISTVFSCFYSCVALLLTLFNMGPFNLSFYHSGEALFWLFVTLFLALNSVSQMIVLRLQDPICVLSFKI